MFSLCQHRSVPDQIADAVVVGGGTIGAWCAYFLRQAGLARVVLIEKDLLGQGASSRAAGVVRVQGGTPTAVRLSQWSRAFYLRQRDEIGTDSGFTEQGYLLPCFTEAEVAAAVRGWRCRPRSASRCGGWTRTRWTRPTRRSRPGRRSAAPSATRTGSSRRRERGRLRGGAGPRRRRGARAGGLPRADGGRVETSQGRIGAGLVVLTGGPKLAEVGRPLACTSRPAASATRWR